MKDRGSHAEQITVESDRLGDVIADDRPDIIIMDVEGSEIDLLCASSLTGMKHITVEIHPHFTGEGQISEMLRQLETRGFHHKTDAHKTLLLSRI